MHTEKNDSFLTWQVVKNVTVSWKNVYIFVHWAIHPGKIGMF